MPHDQRRDLAPLEVIGFTIGWFTLLQIFVRGMGMATEVALVSHRILGSFLPADMMREGEFAGVLEWIVQRMLWLVLYCAPPAIALGMHLRRRHSADELESHRDG